MEEERERALVVGVNINQDPHFTESLEELKNLALACDINPVAEVVQNLKRANAAHYIGSGKLDEIRNLIDQEEIEVLIFEDELTPSQIRNLSKKLDIEILDRSRLILEIFSSRAQTREAKLQVEIARLQYALPRIKNTTQTFNRQRGGTGTRNRGSGETKLELDRRKIEIKIADLEKELQSIALNRHVRRKKRSESGVPLVALVGYTNAGKSTLMNSMVSQYQQADDKLVFEKDMLFATLDTSVRNIKFESGKSILLSDTVGFINKLPHHLVKAFHSTLEEVKEADLLLHVVDCSNSNYQRQIDVTNETLKLISADDIPQIYVFNKIDLISDMNHPVPEGELSVKVSAKKEIGFLELVNILTKQLFSTYRKCQLLIPFDQGQILSYLKDNTSILGISYVETGTLVEADLSEADFGRYRDYVQNELI